MADAHKNFAYSTLSNAPGTGGTTLNVQTGDGTKFPTVPFNATVWPAGVQPTETGNSTTTAEIVRVTSISTDSFTITRQQEGSENRNMASGDQIAASITAKTFTDIESNYVNSWSPYILQTGSGMQTLNANATNASSTGSLFVFPVTLQAPVRFNQILVANSLNFIFSATTTNASNSYYSHFGIFSLASDTLLSLISSNSFSIGETISQSSTSASLTWNYPTSTATSGYGYGSFPAGNLTASAQINSFVIGSRIVGLQFGGEMNLSGGQYWIGMMSIRSTGAQSTYGFSHAGILGQVINPINAVGTQSGLLPFGIPPADWANKNSSDTGWFGRHMIGFLSATSMPNFLGTHIPNNITLSQLGGVAANSTATILPNITFVST